MTPQAETAAKQMIEEAGSVTITVVGDDTEPFDETYDNIDELLSAIRAHENTSTVYF